MYKSDGSHLWGRVDNQQGESSEISADAQSVSVWISKIIRIWYGRKKVVVEIQKSFCGGRKIENLIKSTCFYLKVS